MAKVHIELNSDGIVEMLKSDEIMSVLESHGRSMVSSLGEGYSMSKYPNGKSRGNVSVYADSKDYSAPFAKEKSTPQVSVIYDGVLSVSGKTNHSG